MKCSTYKTPNGIVLTLHSPVSKDNIKSPVIILCHGFCGIRNFLLPDFARAFVEAGFSAITFDYRGFGDSEGERGRLKPSMQTEDILSVIDWVQHQTTLDNEKIGLWGTSFGGCHVFSAAAISGRVKCIVSQLAFADGEAIVTGKMMQDEKISFIASLDKMEEKKQKTGKELLVSITRVLNDPESKAFFEKHKTQYPEMDIKIPFLTVRETLKYSPEMFAAQVSCPALVVLAENDIVNPVVQGHLLFNSVASEEKMLYTEPDAGHYDIYSGAHFKNVACVQTEWFKKYLTD